MATLHLVFSINGARQCQAAGVSTDVVLLDDGIYALTEAAFPTTVRAIADDLKARGFDTQAANAITTAELVRLTVAYERTLSWH